MSKREPPARRHIHSDLVSRPRRCLNGRTACAVFHDDAPRLRWDHRQRQTIFRLLLQQVGQMIGAMAKGNHHLLATVWRVTMESWLRRQRLISVGQNQEQKVSTNSPENWSHNKIGLTVMNTKSIITTGALLLSLFAVRSGTGPEEFAPAKDGFIRDWLVLAPIQLASDADGAEAIDKDQVPDERLVKPKAGDKVTVGGKELAWKKVKASDYALDLNAIVKQQTEKTVGYAVCYVRAESERKDLQLKMGSNDQGKVYLNGKVLLKASEPRSLDQDSDVARSVTLNEGVNVVVFKIFNDGGFDWQGCLRFTDASGKAFTNLVVQLEP